MNIEEIRKRHEAAQDYWDRAWLLERVAELEAALRECLEASRYTNADVNIPLIVNDALSGKGGE